MSNKITKAELLEFEKHPEIVKEYSNGEVKVYWQSELCIHSANCLIELPGVFNTRKKPWININGGTSAEIMKTIDTCPSRALLYLKNPKYKVRKRRKTKKKTAKFARIQVLNNGPILVTGNYIIRDARKKKIRIDGEVAALCRCGGSKKKPFCDGNHLAIGFKG
jgi:uncharacterized Fe-S cluster protein YjdI